MKNEYNVLTKKLLAEGYTVENHPDYVEVGRTCQSKDNPLDNLDGGFQYHRWYLYEKTFKTPCGLQCKGLHLMSGLSIGGVDFDFENDLATVSCPYHNAECEKKHPLLREAGALRCRCNVKMTDEEYLYDGSVECIEKLEDDRINREKISFELQHNGRACQNHMHYDREKGQWEMHYDPCDCGRLKCNGRFGGKYDEDGMMICPILGRPLDKKKGNVYYDIKTTYRRYDLDGTLFEGQIDTEIKKGVRFFKSPVSMDICRNVAKLCKDEIRWKVQSQYHQELFFAEYYGRYFKLEILNIRAEQKESRDLMQDLEDIKNGISIYHASDFERSQKENKRLRIQEAKQKRIKAMEKRILKVGYANMDHCEQNRACKLLNWDRIDELESMREEKEKKEKEQPVQMSLLELFKFDSQEVENEGVYMRK